jgi:negative regulator of sigma E activity
MGSDKYTGNGSAEEPPRASTIEEQLSAFVDGELPHQEMELLLRRLERDEGHRSTFARYVSIGSVLRGDVTQSDRIRVGVLQAITNADEPTVQMPRPVKSGKLGLRVAGLAAVAGICGLAIMGIQPSLTSSGSASLASLEGNAAPLVEELVAPVAVVAVQSRRQALGSERMTSYLASHSEHARTISWRVAEPGFTMQQARLDY